MKLILPILGLLIVLIPYSKGIESSHFFAIEFYVSLLLGGALWAPSVILLLGALTMLVLSVIYKKIKFANYGVILFNLSFIGQTFLVLLGDSTSIGTLMIYLFMLGIYSLILLIEYLK